MIFLELFIRFFFVGLFAIGGGLATVPFLQSMGEVTGWFAQSDIADMIAISESTPGPIAVNMATFVGSSLGGILGALTATLGVVLPSFIIILLIASAFSHLLKYKCVKATLGGIRPAIIALILGTGAIMLLSVIFGISSPASSPNPDYKALVIFAVITVIPFIYGKLRRKKLSPIFLILISGMLGYLLYGA